MATLKEIMGGLERGAGKKLTHEFNCEGEWFEPIFKTAKGYWFGLLDDGHLYSCHEDEMDRWVPYVEKY